MRHLMKLQSICKKIYLSLYMDKNWKLRFSFFHQYVFFKIVHPRDMCNFLKRNASKKVYDNLSRNGDSQLLYFSWKSNVVMQVQFPKVKDFDEKCFFTQPMENWPIAVKRIELDHLHTPQSHTNIWEKIDRSLVISTKKTENCVFLSTDVCACLRAYLYHSRKFLWQSSVRTAIVNFFILYARHFGFFFVSDSAKILIRWCITSGIELE